MDDQQRKIEEVPDFSFKIDFQGISASFLINFPSNANVSKVKTSLQRSDINLSAIIKKL